MRNDLAPRDPEHDPRRLFDIAAAAGRPLYVQAPMVRYSKLPFRALVRDYGVDVCYTPMILAKEFVRSQAARISDFSTNAQDRPLVVQFGARSSEDFSRAAEMVMPYCNGVDLNCGCPQTWAIQEGIGCGLMKRPEAVREMVAAAKRRCGDGFCVSVKIRLHRDLRDTVQFVKIVQDAGADYITVHGRRRSQRSSEPVDLDAIRLVKSIATVPVVANGDVFSLADVARVADGTGVDGVMAARGLLSNPALFAGHAVTPWGAVERFLEYNATCGPLPYALVAYHVGEMVRRVMARRERAEMMRQAGCVVELVDWLDERVVVRRSGEVGFGEGVAVERVQ